MVAPNGARLGRADHPALPLTIAELVDCALACRAVGADGLHAHVRDTEGRHVLDAGLYRELLKEMAALAPRMLVQITTEAVGRYSPAEQRQLVSAVQPAAVSVALREILSDGDLAAAMNFWREAAEAGIAVQHILYDPGEVMHLARLAASGALPEGPLQVLYVLGRYTAGRGSAPADLTPFLDAALAFPESPDWALCAFGRTETACLAAGLIKGGKLRVGFENNLWMADGTVAPNNAARVREVAVMAGKSFGVTGSPHSSEPPS
ncbi:MAG: 3-keto-5-aminohexanoate cleavage protein [Rhodobacteraceae bacterium]|nr:3-keto-5-aminohexanoate cleavage protein [Paracoccaceae bacterium]